MWIVFMYLIFDLFSRWIGSYLSRVVLRWAISLFSRILCPAFTCARWPPRFFLFIFWCGEPADIWKKNELPAHLWTFVSAAAAARRGIGANRTARMSRELSCCCTYQTFTACDVTCATLKHCKIVIRSSLIKSLDPGTGTVTVIKHELS